MNHTDLNPSFDAESSLFEETEILELEDFWAYIYAIYNTTDIRGIIYDEQRFEKLKKLTTEMKIYYNNNDSEPDAIIVGKYYAVFDDEWHRVKCNSYDFKDQTATLFFIDRGDTDIFSIESIQLLDPKFCLLPAQSVKLSLIDLRTFKNCNKILTLMDHLILEKDVYVKVIDFEREVNDIVPTLLVEMILEKNTEEELIINNLLLQEVLKTIVDPKILIGTDKVSQEAYISYVSEDKVFVQLKSEGLEYLGVLINDLTNKYLNNKEYRHKPVSEFDLTKFYITKNPEDYNWYRIKIIKIKNFLEAEVVYIDIGKTAVIKKRNLFLLEDLSKILCKYPEQALEVKLHKISPIIFDKNMANYLRQLAPCTSAYFMKVVGDIHGLPVVQFCKRTEHNSLICLNDILVLESTNNRTEPHDVRLPLKTPNIPDDGEYFDVYVTMAAHPDNLAIQSLSSLPKLEKLMINLLDVCESFSGPHLTPNCVKVGGIYAAQNDDDDKWYRSCVYKIISKGVFAVYDCDYGNYRIVPLKNLQPLQKKFYELPYQAIKAKLVGIDQELEDDWTVNDSLRLNELVVTKKFVSLIESREIDKAVFNEIELDLVLIDTSTDEDIYIADIFSNNKRLLKKKC